MGPYLPRLLTSPSCRAPRHTAPALTGVGYERVSGSRMETFVDDLDDTLSVMDSKTNQKIAYDAGKG